jgi:hypothetical protein
MNIGAANPSGRDTRDTRPFATRPRRALWIDKKGTALETKSRIWFFKMEGCGQTFMFKCKNGFDKSGDARRDVEMPDVGFDRADRTKSLAIRGGAKCLGQSGDFDRIAKRGRGAMTLDIGNRIGVTPAMVWASAMAFA